MIENDDLAGADAFDYGVLFDNQRLGSGQRQFIAAVVSRCTAGCPAVRWEHQWTIVGLRGGCGNIGDLVYVPAKLVYGILGGIAGGAGYVFTAATSRWPTPSGAVRWVAIKY